jgi:succinoglycan biosynthesis protein ExoV
MKIEYFRGEAPNFGDELNPWLWPRLLPNFFDDDPSNLFIGIGSIIGTHYDTKARKIVFGAGFVASYNNLPRVSGWDWDVRFVRGPRTARALGLNPKAGIGDAATLLRILEYPNRPPANYVGFMPHWLSIRRGNWQKVCDLAGLRFIDPRDPVEKVIDNILGCRILLAEAMHGAIVADALRVPWIPLLPVEKYHRAKWFDWADSLGIHLNRYRLWPSNLYEVRLLLEPFNAIIPSLNSVDQPASIIELDRIGESFVLRSKSRALSALKDRILSISADRLLSISRKPPSLSDDRSIDTATERMVHELVLLERDYRVRI